MTKNSNVDILFVGDLHVGSAFSLLPREFKGSAGNVLNFNIGQEYLIGCWEDFLDSVPKQLDALFFNGDIVDGQNWHSRGRFLSEVDPEFQARAAHELVEPLVDKVKVRDGSKPIYISRGSRYHSGRGARDEEFFGALIQPRKNWDGRYTRPWTKLMIGNVMLDIAHHQSSTIRYRSMPLEREMGFLFERFGRSRKQVPEKVVIVRSHVHGSLRVYEECGVTSISLPAWKLQDEFAQSSKWPNRWVSAEIGSAMVRIRGGRVEVVPYTYDHPSFGEETL